MQSPSRGQCFFKLTRRRFEHDKILKITQWLPLECSGFETVYFAQTHAHTKRGFRARDFYNWTNNLTINQSFILKCNNIKYKLDKENASDNASTPVITLHPYIPARQNRLELNNSANFPYIAKTSTLGGNGLNDSFTSCLISTTLCVEKIS